MTRNRPPASSSQLGRVEMGTDAPTATSRQRQPSLKPHGVAPPAGKRKRSGTGVALRVPNVSRRLRRPRPASCLSPQSCMWLCPLRANASRLPGMSGLTSPSNLATRCGVTSTYGKHPWFRSFHLHLVLKTSPRPETGPFASPTRSGCPRPLLHGHAMGLARHGSAPLGG